MIIRRYVGCTSSYIEVDGKREFHETEVIKKLLTSIQPKNLWDILNVVPPTSEHYIGDECEQCGDTMYEELWVI